MGNVGGRTVYLSTEHGTPTMTIEKVLVTPGGHKELSIDIIRYSN